MDDTDGRRQAAKWSEPVELEGDYAGWWVRFDLNTPMGALDDLEAAQKTADLFAMLASLCGESNYVDRTGAPIDLSVTAQWRKVGRELLAETLRAFKSRITRPLAMRSSTSSSPTSPDTDRSSPLVTA
jgi:hypothetical protein